MNDRVDQNIKTHFMTDGDAFIQKIASVLNEIKLTSPLETVTVVSRSNGLLRRLRNSITRGIDGGLFDVRFLSFRGLAHQFGDSLKFPQADLLNEVAIAIALNKVVAQPEYKDAAEVLMQPNFMRALVAMFRELESIPTAELNRVTGINRHNERLLSIIKNARVLLSSYYSFNELAASAISNLNSGNKLGKVVLAMTSPSDVIYRDLCMAVSNLPQTTKVVLLSGQPLDESTCGALGVTNPDGIEYRNSDIQFFSVQNRSDEQQAVMRAVMNQLLSSVPAQKIAVLCPNTTYCETFARAMEMNGIPTSLAMDEKNILATLLKFVQLIMDMASSGVSVQNFTKLMKTTPLSLGATENKLSMNVWSKLWSFLTSHSATLWASKIRDHNDRKHESKLIRELSLYERFMLEFVKDVNVPHKKQPWRVWAEWLKLMVDKYAAVLSVASLNGLSGFDDNVGGFENQDIELDQFSVIVQAQIKNSSRKSNATKPGVIVAPFMDEVGSAFEVVYIVGMETGSYPPQQSSTSTIPEHLRVKLDSSGKILQGGQHKLERQRGLFFSAIKSAPKVEMYWPRFNGETEVFPAEWFMEVLKSNSQKPIKFSDVVALKEPLVHNYVNILNVASGANLESMPDKLTPINESDYDLLTASDITKISKVHTSELQSIRSVIATRDAVVWNTFTGNLSSIGNQLKKSTSQTSFSRLQKFLYCPYDYFLESILGISMEENEYLSVNSIAPLDKGLLVHNILQDLFKNRNKNEFGELNLENRKKLLNKLSQKHFSRAADQFDCGYEALWHYEQKRILYRLELWLETEDQHHKNGWKQEASELKFGHDDKTPVKLDTDETDLIFSGSIDRIDKREVDGRTMIIDYKTGAFRKDDLSMQLPIYALALSQVQPIETDKIIASYWFLLEPEATKRKLNYEFDAASHLQQLKTISSLVASCINRGLFLPDPKCQAGCTTLGVKLNSRAVEEARRNFDFLGKFHESLTESKANS